MISAEMKTKWIEDLRSGKFKKGVGQLYRKKNDCMCALGVLALQMPEYKFTDNGMALELVETGKDHGYRPFYELLGESETDRCFRVSDNSKDFDPVIGWIEENIQTA